jgi:tetratricopeptide (TPR) repeat protein
VPAGGQGLGLGLAAIVHAVVQVDGLGVAIAQLHAGPDAAKKDGPPSPVEAFVPPAAWKEIANRGDGSIAADLVITGSFDPPGSGPGTLQILAFDARDGSTRGRVDRSVDEQFAGASVMSAIEELGAHIGGQVGGPEGLGELGWEPLESVLRAERCALHDPSRGGPHDRFAAMAHLERAIGDAPDAAYPIHRLTNLALETAVGPAQNDAKLLSAAVRALERAVDDAPTSVGLLEALGVLRLRSGQPREAERVLSEAILAAPQRIRLYTLLAQALRAKRDFDGALSVLASAPVAAQDATPLLVERGMVYTERGDTGAAALEWRRVLAREPVQPVAFCGLAGVALQTSDAVAAQSLVDAALAAPSAHPDVLRRAVHLVMVTEAVGIARASRVARLCSRLLEIVPNEASAALAWAQALIMLGERKEARARLVQAERLAPGSAVEAEAQIARLGFDDPRTNDEVKSVLRAALGAAPSAMADVSARARKLGTMHAVWTAWLAAGIADRKRGKLAAAREAFEVALEIAAGATPVHLELSGLLVALGEASKAVSHAERALTLEGESPRALKVLARSLVAAGRRIDALRASARALEMQPNDAELRQVVALLRGSHIEGSWGTRVRALLRRWRF